MEKNASPADKDPEPDGKRFQGHSSHARAHTRAPARPREARRSAWPALPAFHLVIAGSSISMLGTKISTLAFPMLILWLGKSPELVGLSVFITVIPGLLLYFPAGIFVDKTNPWRVMFCSEILRGIVAVSIVIALLRFNRNVNITFLILAMFTEEVLEMFSTLAERRYLNRMMDPDETKERRSQQASIEARAHIAVLAGRPVAPFLFTLGPLSPFLADAASFVFSVAGLLLGEGNWKPRNSSHSTDAGKPTARCPPQPASKTSSVSDVIKSVRHDSTVWLGAPLMAMTSMVSQALILIFLTEAHSHQFSTAGIGMMLAASGLGGATGSYCSKFMPDPVRRRWIPLQMTAWLAACAGLALTGGRSAWLAGCTMFIFSITGAISNVEFSTYLNLTVEDDMLGKISGICYAMSIGACALGPVIGGFSVQKIGIRNAVIFLLAIVFLMTLGSLPLLRKSRDGRAGMPATEHPATTVHLPETANSPSEESPTPCAIPAEEPAGARAEHLQQPALRLRDGISVAHVTLPRPAYNALPSDSPDLVQH